MSDILPVPGASPDTLRAQLDALLADGDDPVTLMANAAALLYWSLPDVNWAGFYLSRGGDLVLGPFHGLPACTRIPEGTGVCGAAARDLRQINVPDVRAFPGHIACDAASRSELVTPVLVHGALVAVLDLDSPRPARFTSAEEAIARHAAACLGARLENRQGAVFA